jgi:hypothetical protein
MTVKIVYLQDNRRCLSSSLAQEICDNLEHLSGNLINSFSACISSKQNHIAYQRVNICIIQG